MEKSEIQSDINRLARRLNIKRPKNKIRRHIDAIESGLEDSENPRDWREKRSQRTLTNHEQATTDQPVESSEIRIQIPEKSVRNLESELEEIIEQIEQLHDEIDRLDPDGLSNSLREVTNRIYGTKDELEASLFNVNGMARFREYADLINSAEDEKEIQRLRESLDRVKNECETASSTLMSIKIPDEETVGREVEETRRERAKREFERMKPFMSMRRIRREFNIGDTFTPEELASRIDSWDAETAKSSIQDAMDAPGSPSIEKIGGDTYKLVE